MGATMGTLRILGSVAATLLVACTVDNSDESPFGATSVSSTATTLSTTTPATGESTSGSESDSTAESSTAAAESSSSGDESSSSGGSDPTMATSDDGTSGGGNGMQPADGMYSSCAVAMDCGVVPELCITISDAMMMPLGGFCSQTGCMNPAVDCDPAPGGTATPVCMPIEVDDEEEQACALSCTGGLVCPVPMQCHPLAGGNFCA